MLDFLKDFQACFLLKPFAPTPEGPQEPLVLNAASRRLLAGIGWPEHPPLARATQSPIQLVVHWMLIHELFHDLL